MFLFRKAKQKNQDGYLDNLYASIWNGQDVDRTYAWFRVINHLKTWHNKPELILRATARMERERNERSEDYYVNQRGKMIRIIQIT